MVPSATLPGNTGSMEKLSKVEEELEMAFYLAFIDLSPRELCVFVPPFEDTQRWLPPPTPMFMHMP